MKQRIVLLLCILSAFNIHAQSNRVKLDSLLNKVKHVTNDSVSVRLQLEVGYTYERMFEIDSSNLYVNKALVLAKDMKWKKGVAEAILQLGINQGLATHYLPELDYYEQALKVFAQIKDSNKIAEVYSRQGTAYYNIGQSARALELYMKSSAIFQEIGYRKRSADVLMYIGNIYSEGGGTKKTKEYYDKALVIYQEEGLVYDEAYLHTNIAIDYAMQGELDSALSYYTVAIDMFEKLGAEEDVIKGEQIVGRIYAGKGDYDRAIEILEKTNEALIDKSSALTQAQSMFLLGSTYMEYGMSVDEYVTKSKYFKKPKVANIKHAIKLFEALKQKYESGELESIQEQSKLYRNMRMAYDAVGDIPKAYDIYLQYTDLVDSIIRQEDGKKIAQLEGKQALAIKDKELEIQDLEIKQKQRERWYMLGGMILLLGGLTVIYRNYRERGRVNKMLAKEKERSEGLLLNILPEEVAEELKDKGSAEAQMHHNVTVLFTDFVGFTKVSERLTAKELVNELHECFKAFDEIISKYHIEKIKTIGDAYLAVSGLPVHDAQHAKKTIQAALEIQAYMAERYQRLGDDTFQIRIGIHSGDVVAGIVGVKKFAYDIWGDTVNTAARMEQNSEVGKVNVSHATYQLIKDKYRYTYRGELEAKNKGKLKMYFVE